MIRMNSLIKLTRFIDKKGMNYKLRKVKFDDLGNGCAIAFFENGESKMYEIKNEEILEKDNIACCE